MTLAAALMRLKLPTRFTVMTLAKKSEAMGPSLPSTRPAPRMPAQFTANCRLRSEERRVGKECRSRWSPYDYKKNYRCRSRAVLRIWHQQFPTRNGRAGQICTLWKHVLKRIFFFQAEDGIRDGRVTGVQTCALPI